MKTNREKLSEVLEKRGYKNEDLINEIEQIYSKQQLPIHGVSSSFKVGTYSLYNQDNNSYYHWSEGLKMVIEKNGSIMKLEGEEINKLVSSLPRTIGGVY